MKVIVLADIPPQTRALVFALDVKDAEDRPRARSPDDLTTCSDIDMMSLNADGRFVDKDGSPYP